MNQEVLLAQFTKEEAQKLVQPLTELRSRSEALLEFKAQGRPLDEYLGPEYYNGQTFEQMKEPSLDGIKKIFSNPKLRLRMAFGSSYALSLSAIISDLFINNENILKAGVALSLCSVIGWSVNEWQYNLDQAIKKDQPKKS